MEMKKKMLFAVCNDCKTIIGKEPDIEKEDELIDIGYEHLNEGDCESFRIFEEDENWKQGYK